MMFGQKSKLDLDSLKTTAKAYFPNLDPLLAVLRSELQPLMVCLSHSWGGLEQVTAYDSLDLASIGLKPKVLCFQDSPLYENLVQYPEVQLLPLSFSPRNYFDLRLKAELEKTLHEGINLIHTHQTSLLGSIAPWLWNRPQVALFATRHIMNNHYKKDFFHRALYARLDALLVMSDMLRKNVLDTHSIRDRRVKVVRLGLNFDYFDASKVDGEGQRAQWGADSQTKVIGMVGRIDPAKGQSTLIKAVAGLMKGRKLKDRIKIVIVGEETLGSTKYHLEELHQMVLQFGLENEVIFTGFQDNIPEIMKGFDIFVMPSREEAFGLVAIEAMAMEVPIIISKGGSAREIVGEDEFGLTVRPDDAFDLQQKLRFLLDSPEEGKEMGRRARQHVQFHFDRKKRVVDTLQLYYTALRKRRSL